MNVDAVTCSYLNMVLSLRGAERQAPNLLQMALRFSVAMQVRAEQGVHPKDWTTEQRLRKIIAEYQETPGFISKWSLDEEKVMSILNLISGTCEEARDQIRNHLNYAKWAQSAFNVELLRRPRWLLGAGLKGVPDNFKKILTVRPVSQEMFLRLVIQVFSERGRKVRPSQRAKVRLTGQEWDQFMNYTCVMHAAMEEAKNLSSAKPGCLDQLVKAFEALCLGFWVLIF